MDTVALPRVVASVVIPAWRLTTELRECLDSLARMVDAPAFEVVVVVNGADETVMATAQNHALAPRVIPLPANVGFAWACNAGALAARGEYVVFLNDDTQVEPRWLAEMVGVAVRQEAVCVAGVLLDEEGRLHEAGAHVLSTAGTVPRGAGLSLEAAVRDGVLREAPIEYGSGASLLVAVEVFRALGGFDLGYSPAYYEDVDLQFRLREAGHDVWLAPAARVMHMTNGSTGDRSYFRTWASARAGAHFIGRWGGVLETLPCTAADIDGLSPVPRADRRPVGGLDGVLDPDHVLRQAIRIQTEYATWLEAALVASDHGALEAKIDELSAQFHELSQQNHARMVRVAELEAEGAVGRETFARYRARLSRLESLGPAGLMRDYVSRRVGRSRRVSEP